jgi:hypothetical protein
MAFFAFTLSPCSLFSFLALIAQSVGKGDSAEQVRHKEEEGLCMLVRRS